VTAPVKALRVGESVKFSRVEDALDFFREQRELLGSKDGRNSLSIARPANGHCVVRRPE
jgi:hypothetical protein